MDSATFASLFFAADKLWVDIFVPDPPPPLFFLDQLFFLGLGNELTSLVDVCHGKP